MVRILIPLLVTLVSNNAILADNGERITSLKQLCISDQGTGFNWKKGSWEQVNFVEDRFVVSKIDVPDIPPEGWKGLEPEERLNIWITIRCDKSDFREETEGDFRIYHSCLKLQGLGEKYAKYFECNELHYKEENSWVTKFNCRSGPAHSLSMTKDGNFIRSSVPSDLSSDPKNDYKDSLSIFVGRCASVED